MSDPEQARSVDIETDAGDYSPALANDDISVIKPIVELVDDVAPSSHPHDAGAEFDNPEAASLELEGHNNQPDPSELERFEGAVTQDGVRDFLNKAANHDY